MRRWWVAQVPAPTILEKLIPHIVAMIAVSAALTEFQYLRFHGPDQGCARRLH